MGVIVIEAIKQAPFIKGAKSYIGTDIDADPTGREVVEEYEGKWLPNTSRVLKPNLSLSKGKFVYDETYMSDKDFERLIPLCGFYNDKNELITSANLHSDADPFMNQLSVRIVDGKAVLDDSIERNRVLAAFFMKDRRFKVIGDNSPVGQSREEYLIGFQDAIERQRVMAKQIEMNIAVQLQDMSRKKLLMLCKIWDYKPPEVTDDQKLRAFLYDKTNTNQYMGKQTRAQWFSTYAEMNEQDLGFWDLFLDARRLRVITQNSEDNYAFGTRVIGRHFQECVDYLMMPGNGQLVKDLREAVKSKRKGKNDLPPLNLAPADDGSQQPNP